MVHVRHTLVLCGALLACSPGLWPGARAADPGTAVRFELPAGRLDDALEALARQAGVQLLYDPALVARKTSRALRLRGDAASALNRLLDGSGLRGVRIDDGTFVLKAVPAPPPRPPRDAVVVAHPATSIPIQMGAVQVTGSRIPRSDIDTATTLPLVVIPRQEIEASGKQTLFELLRFQPGMTAHHPIDVSADGVTDAQQPFAVAATTSLNSLGPRATLFLVDGQRVANYGLVSSDLGGLTDLDGIPLSIVERIEILRGGASAVYGADAMAGVVNIILRKSERGGEVVARYGMSERGDAGERRVSFGFGRDNDRGGGVFVGGEYFDRDELLGADRGWRTLDRRAQGLGDARYQLGYGTYGAATDLFDPERGPSGRLLQAYCRPDGASIGADCRLDPPRGISLQPETRRGSLYVHAHQPVGEHAELHADLRVGSVRQLLHNPPFYARLLLPPDHPDNPLGADYIDYAFGDLGPVRSQTRADTVDATLGMRGAFGDWTWNADGGHHESSVVNRTDALVRISTFRQRIGDYRFDGDNAPDLRDAISPRISARGKSTQQQLSFDVGGPWFPLPGGTVQVAAGVEYDHESLRHRPDALLLEDDVALGEGKTAIDAARDNAALYAELTLPLLPRLQADVAARVDYREGYGHHTSPKFGLKWSPLDGLTLRGTRASGFRAPSLFELRRPSDPASFDIIMAGPLGPCLDSFETDGQLYCIVTRGSIENRDLRPEVSRSDTLGFVWSPSADFSVSVDHYRILRRDEILPVGSGDDPVLFKDSVERDAQGLLVGVYDHYDNVGRTDVRGWQFDTLYHHDAARAGRLTLRLSGDWLQSVRRRARVGQADYDYAGYGAPIYSLLGSTQWDIGDWSAALDVRRIGSQRVGAPETGCPAINLKAERCRSPGATTLDANLAWSGLRGWTFALNVQNLTDRAPVNYDIDKGGYAIAYDDPRGRYFLVSVGYRF